MRSVLRPVIAGFIAGLIGVSAAIAGSVLRPMEAPSQITASDVLKDAGIELPGKAASVGFDIELDPSEVAGLKSAVIKAPSSGKLASGFLVGASRGSFAPSPSHFGGGTWQTQGCTEIDNGKLDQDHLVASMDDPRGWPAASPDCIYLGGFGIGPARAARSLDPGGVWVRSIAISNGETTFVYQITDTVGWFARYDSNICTDCGLLDIRQKLGLDLGVPADNIVIASTHSHATADTYGGWGGMPDWYRAQLRDTVIASAKQAVANMRPATIVTGEGNLRSRNNERRDTYRSNADSGAAWLQAKALPETLGGPEPVIATLATFAAHPTMVNRIDGVGILHADWPGAAARRFEEMYSDPSLPSVGLMFEGGLGNTSVSEVKLPALPGETEGQKKLRDVVATGNAIADAVAQNISADAKQLQDNSMAAVVVPITHPVMTNPGLATLASAGFFDREFLPGTPGADGPGAYRWSKSHQASTAEGAKGEMKPEALRSCDSASAIQIKTSAGAHRIGGMMIAFTPGEIFSNISEVIKEDSNRSVSTLVFGQANDALGYIIQSFEYDTQGNVVTEYGTQTGEYEEVFAIDRCFGDHVLDAVRTATVQLGLN